MFRGFFLEIIVLCALLAPLGIPDRAPPHGAPQREPVGQACRHRTGRSPGWQLARLAGFGLRLLLLLRLSGLDFGLDFLILIWLDFWFDFWFDFWLDFDLDFHFHFDLILIWFDFDLIFVWFWFDFDSMLIRFWLDFAWFRVDLAGFRLDSVWLGV